MSKAAESRIIITNAESLDPVALEAIQVLLGTLGMADNIELRSARLRYDADKVTQLIDPHSLLNAPGTVPVITYTTLMNYRNSAGEHPVALSFITGQLFRRADEIDWLEPYFLYSDPVLQNSKVTRRPLGILADRAAELAEKRELQWLHPIGRGSAVAFREFCEDVAVVEEYRIV